MKLSGPSAGNAEILSVNMMLSGGSPLQLGPNIWRNLSTRITAAQIIRTTYRFWITCDIPIEVNTPTVCPYCGR